MEGLIAAIAPNVVQLLGVVITGLITWGVSMLKQKTAADIGKKALDEVDRVTATVVDGLTQTMAEQLRAAYADGKWTDEDKKEYQGRGRKPDTGAAFNVRDRFGGQDRRRPARVHRHQDRGTGLCAETMAHRLGADRKCRAASG